MNRNKIAIAFVCGLMGAGFVYADVDLPTQFTNKGGIANTRHNMTQRPTDNTLSLNGAAMDAYRNNYGEVCVYCHTPHGANTTVTLPLWNRTMKTNTYATYNQLGTSSLTQVVSEVPGAASLSCLSCHDGTTAVDSIINMPGSGRYDPNQATGQSEAFLDSWTGITSRNHMALNGAGCLACHAPDTPTGSNATDFSVFAIGTDLKNDHPVGITFPTTNGTGTDFNTPGGTRGSAAFFDDGDGIMETKELRVYGGKVECASCHDPHGVPSGAAGSQFNPTFLRVANVGSALCLTCHVK